jgi:hypothetical protein
MQLPLLWRSSLLRLLRATLVIGLMLLGGLILVCGLVFVQGQRDEVRRSDALLLAADRPPETALIEHTLALYRQGYAGHIILAHPDALDLKAELTGDQWRLPENALIAVEDAETRVQYLRLAAGQARSRGIQSVVITSDPADILLELKMAQDLGFNAYGSPPPGSPLAAGRVLAAGLHYWQYVLIGR